MHVTAIEPALATDRRPLVSISCIPRTKWPTNRLRSGRIPGFSGRYGHPMHAASLGTASGSFNEPTGGWSSDERPIGSSGEPSDVRRRIQPSFGSFSEPSSGRTAAHWSLGSFDEPRGPSKGCAGDFRADLRAGRRARGGRAAVRGRHGRRRPAAHVGETGCGGDRPSGRHDRGLGRRQLRPARGRARSASLDGRRPAAPAAALEGRPRRGPARGRNRRTRDVVPLGGNAGDLRGTAPSCADPVGCRHHSDRRGARRARRRQRLARLPVRPGRGGGGVPGRDRRGRHGPPPGRA